MILPEKPTEEMYAALRPMAGNELCDNADDEVIARIWIAMREALYTQQQACVCENGHDRPYWKCPVHGDVSV